MQEFAGLAKHWFKDQGSSGPWNSSTRFNGVLDDVRIYNRTLSDNEIDSLYHEGGWVDLNSDLVAYYPFNGDANDESGNGNHGSSNGSINFGEGIIGPALLLGGVSNPGFISVANSPSLQFTSNTATICYWLRRTDPFGQTWSDCSQSIEYGAEHVVLAKCCDRYGFSSRIGLSQDTLYKGDIGIDAFSSTVAGTNFSTSIEMGNWLHVVTTMSSSGTKIFVNGQLASEDSTSVSFVRMNNRPMYIGIQGGAGSCLPWWGQFEGFIDEVRLYNRILTSAEIESLYNYRPVISVPVLLNDRWNIISLPVKVYDQRKSILFPTAVSNAFAYNPNLGYAQKDTLINGSGYWLKFDSAQTISITGFPITLDTIEIEEGWNLIGSISTPVSVSSITSVPVGIVTSSFFSYSGGYQQTDTIYPGKGYWVKVNQNGKLILSSVASNEASASSRIRIVASPEFPPPPPEEDLTNSTEPKPREFALSQNYPNPFNPLTVIRYQLPVESKVTLRIYNVLGQEVKSLVDEIQDAGYKSVEWNAGGLASGVYFYRLRAGDYVAIKKLLLMK